MDDEGTIERRHKEAWEQFMAAERKELKMRKASHRARALGVPLPGESAAALERYAEEDRELAERGLVELREGTRVWHKHIDDLTREDQGARLEAHTALTEWLMDRQRRRRPAT